jgi:2-amino-4-hydroxy-6-hydroxymethyldihydropteridine diphosphokinase
MADRTYYLGLGSNLGDREANISNALSALLRDEVEVVKRSSLYETEPRDVPDQPWFLNLVAECRTRLFPFQLMDLLLRMERELGRRRASGVGRGPRPIDLDILLAGHAVIQTPKLTVPHPRMRERRFVLEPLLEIAPDLKDPESGRPFSVFLAATKSQKVRKLVSQGANVGTPAMRGRA